MTAVYPISTQFMARTVKNKKPGSIPTNPNFNTRVKNGKSTLTSITSEPATTIPIATASFPQIPS